MCSIYATKYFYVTKLEPLTNIHVMYYVYMIDIIATIVYDIDNVNDRNQPQRTREVHHEGFEDNLGRNERGIQGC